MKDWKRELRMLMNCVDPHGDVKTFWDAIDLGQRYSLDDLLAIRKVISPILESLLSEQEAEHKKQMREAIRYCEEMMQTIVDGTLGKLAHDAGIESPKINTQNVEKVLFKKYNCEEEKK